RAEPGCSRQRDVHGGAVRAPDTARRAGSRGRTVRWMARGSAMTKRALDLSTGVGAAYAGRMLAEVGWDVVKVEPSSGDPLRAEESRWGGGRGGAFAFANYGKRGIVVEDGNDIFDLAR